MVLCKESLIKYRFFFSRHQALFNETHLDCQSQSWFMPINGPSKPASICFVAFDKMILNLGRIKHYWYDLNTTSASEFRNVIAPVHTECRCLFMKPVCWSFTLLCKILCGVLKILSYCSEFCSWHILSSLNSLPTRYKTVHFNGLLIYCTLFWCTY